MPRSPPSQIQNADVVIRGRLFFDLTPDNHPPRGLKMRYRIKLILALLVGAFIAGVLTGCGPYASNTQQRPRDRIHVAALSIESPGQHEVPARQDLPVAVCLLVDFSGSMARYPIRPPRLEALVQLLRAISNVGGTFSYGSIADRPTAPLERIFLAPPEERPTVESATNPFIRKKLQRQIQNELPGYQAREEDRRISNEALIQDYAHGLKEWLNRSPTAPSTDIWSSLNRCELALMEDPMFWEEATGHVPERWVFIVSDGEHTAAHSSFTPLHRSISVVVATGRRGAGNLERLRPPPYWFESTDAAIRYLLTYIQRRN